MFYCPITRISLPGSSSKALMRKMAAPLLGCCYCCWRSLALFSLPRFEPSALTRLSAQWLNWPRQRSLPLDLVSGWDWKGGDHLSQRPIGDRVGQEVRQPHQIDKVVVTLANVAAVMSHLPETHKCSNHLSSMIMLGLVAINAILWKIFEIRAFFVEANETNFQAATTFALFHQVKSENVSWWCLVLIHNYKNWL